MTMSMAQLGQAEDTQNVIKEKLRLTMPKARVTQVIDGQTLIVNNTTTIHLPAIYIPWEMHDNQGAYGKAAKDAFEKEFLDKFVRVFQVKDQDRGQFNALGHTEGYVMREDGVLAQSTLVANGLAFAYPSQSHFDLADILYKDELVARASKLGLWADDKNFQILDAETAKTADMNRFAIIEGTLQNVVARNNVIYLNFERDWKTDTTIAMDNGLRREFSKAGINVMQLNGQKIRARGWLRDYNGPYMEVFHPSQIEIIE